MSARALSTSLRMSLLASLGLLPVACGGSFRGNDDADGGTATTAGSESGGSSATAGAGSGGSSASAGSVSGGTTAIAGSGVGGTVVSGGGGSAPNLPTCTAPVTDPETGIVACGEGYRYRSRNHQCATPTDEPSEPKPPLSDNVDCKNDPTVCDQYLRGYCASSDDPFAPRYCATGCLTDSDCEAGTTCRCEGGKYGVCASDTCRSDADCTPGYHCASYPKSCGYHPYACQTPTDDCAQCSGSGSYSCTMTAEGHRECQSGLACGRPFLVEATIRVAPVTSRGDWTERGLAPQVSHLSPAERAAEAAHWTKLGQMEHASIAAFARFQLQLLALGAPSALVQACNQALMDETAHTQLCFALASAYAGSAIGPGPLDVSHSLDVTSLADVVDLVIAEGCFGETSAALEALESALSAVDPVIRDAYTRIAADEQRHAELAFQFVRWALQHGGAEVRRRVSRAVREPTSSSAGARAVTLPCLQALLGAKWLAIPAPALCANCATHGDPNGNSSSNLLT